MLAKRFRYSAGVTLTFRAISMRPTSDRRETCGLPRSRKPRAPPDAPQTQKHPVARAHNRTRTRMEFDGASMQTVKTGPNAVFVEKQRQQLLRLRANLLAAARETEADEADARGQDTREAVESEEDAQRLDTLERDGNIVVRDVQRLESVDRALKKIEEGTYGLSDLSGQPIPRDRLEAIPDALYTLSEEERREKPRVG
jgi:DnaK suppressor protein